MTLVGTKGCNPAAFGVTESFLLLSSVCAVLAACLFKCPYDHIPLKTTQVYFY